MRTYINMTKAFLAYWFVMLLPDWAWLHNDAIISNAGSWAYKPDGIPAKAWFSPGFNWEDWK